MIFKSALTGVALLLLGTSAVAVEVEKPKQLLAMTPQDFRQAVSVDEDPLEFVATLSTEPAFRNGKGLAKVVWNDAHLRAVVDKRTGVIRYEVQQVLRHQHGDRNYVQVNYLTPKGLRTATPVVSDIHNNSCDHFEGGRSCVVFRKMSFEVAEQDIRDMAATYAPGNHGNFAFRFKDVAGEHHTNKLVTAEVVGLVQAVDHYKSTAGLKAASSTELASADPS
ncbi:hypothetical protein [Glacieibacterium sp.]|uniref:hypothetical protein n=1 Tax=Glacieibacterium sp. TaxID=2860237 RepID=UPI003AFFA3F1